MRTHRGIRRGPVEQHVYSVRVMRSGGSFSSTVMIGSGMLPQPLIDNALDAAWKVKSADGRRKVKITITSTSGNEMEVQYVAKSYDDIEALRAQIMETMNTWP